ncbi:MAG: hypothetical protein ABEJ89_07280 [Haloarculaceae archaeon]
MDDAGKAAAWGGFGLLALVLALLNGNLGPVTVLQALAGLASLAVAGLLVRRAGLI